MGKCSSGREFLLLFVFNNVSGSMAYLLLHPTIVMTIWLWLFKTEFGKKKQILLTRWEKQNWQNWAKTYQCWRKARVSARGPNLGYHVNHMKALTFKYSGCSQTKSSTSPETEESLGRKAENSRGLYSLYKVCTAEMGAGICSRP